MYPQGSLAKPGTLDSLIARINALRPDSPRQWGRMTPHQMLCHVADAFDAVMGDRPMKAVDNFMRRNVVKFIALHTPLPWPKGVPTGREVDAEAGGTKPVDFEQDRQRALTLLRRFVDPATSFGPHPVFGPLTHTEWMMWGFAHVDHHLRQFSA